MVTQSGHCGCTCAIRTPRQPHVRKAYAGMLPLLLPTPKRPPHSFPLGQELLSLLVNKGASCHLRCWLSSKVLADKSLRLLGSQEVLKALAAESRKL